MAITKIKMENNKELNLITVFSQVTVKILKSFASDLKIEFHKNFKKKELSSLIANAILNDPQGLVDILFTYELKYIKYVIENPHLKLHRPPLSFPPIYLFEEKDVFSPRLIDGIIDKLQKYNDVNLRRDTYSNHDEMMKQVRKYWHCG